MASHSSKALAVFLDPQRVDYDVTHPEDEEARRKVVGRLKFGVVSVVYTVRGDFTRVISARRANASEERRYGDRWIHPGPYQPPGAVGGK